MSVVCGAVIAEGSLQNVGSTQLSSVNEQVASGHMLALAILAIRCSDPFKVLRDLLREV